MVNVASAAAAAPGSVQLAFPQYTMRPTTDVVTAAAPPPPPLFFLSSLGTSRRCKAVGIECTDQGCTLRLVVSGMVCKINSFCADKKVLLVPPLLHCCNSAGRIHDNVVFVSDEPPPPPHPKTWKSNRSRLDKVPITMVTVRVVVDKFDKDEDVGSVSKHRVVVVVMVVVLLSCADQKIWNHIIFRAKYPNGGGNQPFLERRTDARTINLFLSRVWCGVVAAGSLQKRGHERALCATTTTVAVQQQQPLRGLLLALLRR
jgi:hypothetical protein